MISPPIKSCIEDGFIFSDNSRALLTSYLLANVSYYRKLYSIVVQFPPINSGYIDIEMSGRLNKCTLVTDALPIDIPVYSRLTIFSLDLTAHEA